MMVAIFDPETGRPHSIYMMDQVEAMSVTMATCVPLGHPSRDLSSTRFKGVVTPLALPYLDELDAAIREDGQEPTGYVHEPTGNPSS